MCPGIRNTLTINAPLKTGAELLFRNLSPWTCLVGKSARYWRSENRSRFEERDSLDQSMASAPKSTQRMDGAIALAKAAAKHCGSSIFWPTAVSTTYNNISHHCSGITPGHVQSAFSLVQSPCSRVSQSSASPPRESRAPAATHCAEAAPSTADPRLLAPHVRGDLCCVERRSLWPSHSPSSPIVRPSGALYRALAIVARTTFSCIEGMPACSWKASNRSEAPLRESSKVSTTIAPPSFLWSRAGL